jgi:hypothetical protein
MSFRFWKKTENKEEESLPGPKTVPEPVGRHLVVKMHKDPDWVWNLKGVIKRHQGDSNTQFDFRVYDDANVASKSIRVKDYRTFDAHPELILFEGWFDKKTLQVYAEEKGPVEFKKAS